MSGGASQVTAATPWGAAQPYLQDIMGKAQQTYGSQAPMFQGANGNFNYGNVTGAVGSAINQSTPFGSIATGVAPGTTAAIQQNLTGTPDYTAVKGALDAANQQTWNSFNNTEIPALNQRASFLGNPSGAIKDLNWATSQIGNNMDLNAQQQYLGEYDRAKAAQLSAAGLGANVAQGAGSQALQGASQYGSIAGLPSANLQDYANIVSGTGGKFGTSTENTNPGAAGTAANIIGGLTAGAGLVNTLTGSGTSNGGTIGAIGRMFGGGLGSGVDTAAAGSAAGSAAAGLGSGASAGMAGTAADVAAANSAWLSSPAAASTWGSIGTPAAIDAAGTAGAGSAAAGAGAAEGAATAGGAGAAGGSAAPLLGPAAGGATAIALPLAIAAYGYSKPAVELGKAYWSGVSSALDQPKDSQAYKAAALELAAGMSSPGTSNQIPAEIYAKAAQLGITPLGANIDPNAVRGWRGYGQYAGNVRPN